MKPFQSLLCVFAAAASAMPHPFPQPGPLALALAQGGLDSSSFLPAAPLQQGQPLRRQVRTGRRQVVRNLNEKNEYGIRKFSMSLVRVGNVCLY